MQPSDEIVADMFQAVTCGLIRQHLRLHARCLDLELNLTATLQCNEPESGVIDAVAAARNSLIVDHISAIGERHNRFTRCHIGGDARCRQPVQLCVDRIEIACPAAKLCDAVDGIAQAGAVGGEILTGFQLGVASFPVKGDDTKQDVRRCTCLLYTSPSPRD